MYDYHTHSNFSSDSDTPMEEMVKKAISLGIKEYAVTDHYDAEYPDPTEPFNIDFPNYHKEILHLKNKYKTEINLIKGVEIGIQHGEILSKSKEAVVAFPYDFVIGSFHCAEGMDIYRRPFFTGRSVEASFMVFYEYMLSSLKEYKDYDVLGHFNIIDRYGDYIPEDSLYEDIIDEILKLLIEEGKGIEINTSSFRYNMGERTTPTKAILNRYVELGGETVTIGSDAHRVKDVGFKLDFALERLKASGLSYLATFKERKVNYVKI